MRGCRGGGGQRGVRMGRQMLRGAQRKGGGFGRRNPPPPLHGGQAGVAAGEGRTGGAGRRHVPVVATTVTPPRAALPSCESRVASRAGICSDGRMVISRHNGRWTLEDRFGCPWQYLPVEVPDGACGLRAELEYDRSNAAVLDLGCIA